MEGRNKGLVVFGIVLLVIGLFASFYKITRRVGQPPAVVIVQTSYPYQNVGIILDVTGITCIALGFLYSPQKMPPPPSNPPV